MSQTWVFRKDDYDKLVHKLKVLSDRVEQLEKKEATATQPSKVDLDAGKDLEKTAGPR